MKNLWCLLIFLQEILGLVTSEWAINSTVSQKRSKRQWMPVCNTPLPSFLQYPYQNWYPYPGPFLSPFQWGNYPVIPNYFMRKNEFDKEKFEKLVTNSNKNPINRQLGCLLTKDSYCYPFNTNNEHEGKSVKLTDPPIKLACCTGNNVFKRVKVCAPKGLYYTCQCAKFQKPCGNGLPCCQKDQFCNKGTKTCLQNSNVNCLARNEKCYSGDECCSNKCAFNYQGVRVCY